MEQISRRTVLAGLGGLGGVAALSACGDEPESTLEDGPTTPDLTVEDDGTSTSPDEASSTTRATLETVDDLASPKELRDRWAAYAALWLAVPISDDGGGPRVEDGHWVYEMPLGQWARLVHLKKDRAVLFGSSNPDIRQSDAEEKDARASMLEGAPSWWSGYEQAVQKFSTIGFIIGWDGKRWQQSSAAPTDGGFADLTFHIATRKKLGQQLAKWGSKGEEGYEGSMRAAADRVMDAGTKVTAADLRALGPGIAADNLSAAVGAARAFEGEPKKGGGSSTG